ncbi:hypothetical protein Btru_045105 [Bulinus truncatus]|nr:hypothetical protein Btru_045105 [Bulinus truncatus]
MSEPESNFDLFLNIMQLDSKISLWIVLLLCISVSAQLYSNLYTLRTRYSTLFKPSAVSGVVLSVNECAMICGQSKNCSAFSYDNQTMNCTLAKGSILASFKTLEKFQILQRRTNHYIIGLDEFQEKGVYRWHDDGSAMDRSYMNLTFWPGQCVISQPTMTSSPATIYKTQQPSCDSTCGPSQTAVPIYNRYSPLFKPSMMSGYVKSLFGCARSCHGNNNTCSAFSYDRENLTCTQGFTVETNGNTCACLWWSDIDKHWTDAKLDCQVLSLTFNTLPFTDCSTGDLDVVFIVEFTDVVVFKRFINILSFFFDIRRKSIGLLRVAVFQTDYYKDRIQKLIISFANVQEQTQWYYKYIIFLDKADELKDIMVVSLKLCGICPQGWVQFQQQFYITSCYEVIERKDPVSSFDAEGICSEYKSDLLNIESREELKFVQKIFSSITLNSTNQTEILQQRTPLGLRLSITSEPVRYQWSNERPFMLGTYYYNARSLYNLKFSPCVSILVIKNSNNISNTGKIFFDHDCNLKSFNVFICERDVLRNWTSFDQLNPDQIVLNVSTETTHVGREFLFNCQENDQYLPYTKVCDGKLDCQSRLDEDFCSGKQQKRYNQIKYNTLKNKIYRKQFNFFSSSIFLQGCEEKMCYIPDICLPAQWFINDICEVTFHEDQGVLCINERCSRTFEYVLCNGEKDKINRMKKECIQQNRTRCTFSYGIKLAPKCIYLRNINGYPLGCPDFSHLENCENFICPDDLVKCPLSYCIQVHYVGDGLMDCRYGEDEYFLVQVGNDQLKQCLLHAQPGEIIHVCDKSFDCDNFADELNCSTICPDGFKCQEGVMLSNGMMFPGSHIRIEKFTKVLKISNVNLSSVDLHFFEYEQFLELHMVNCNIQSLSQFKIVGNKDVLRKGIFNNTYKVDFSYNNITFINRIGFFTFLYNLLFLSLSNNQNLDIVEENSIRSNFLRVLDFSFTKISSLPSHIFESKFLQLANLTNTNIMSISWIVHNMRLKTLDLTNTKINVQLLSANEFKDVKITDNLLTDNYKLCCALILGPNTSPDVCHSPRDAISSCDDLLADKTKRVLLWIVASVSFIGNVVVLSYRYLIDRDILKLSYGVFIINLGISDFIMSIYLIIIAAVDIYYRDVYVLNEHQWRYSPFCKAAGFLSTLSSETSTFFVFLITMDRFLAIRFPFQNYRFSKTHVLFSVFLVWTVGFVIALIPILFPDVAIYSSNGMCLGLPLYYNQKPGWTYAMIIFIILNSIIFILVATGQVAIYIAATRGNTSLVVNQSKRKKDVDVAKQLSLIAMSNFLCWFPVSLIGLLSMTGTSVSLETYAWIVVFILPLNSAVNPNIYTIPFVYNKWKKFKDKKNSRSNSGKETMTLAVVLGFVVRRGPDVVRRVPDAVRRGPDSVKRGRDVVRRGPDVVRRGPDVV